MGKRTFDIILGLLLLPILALPMLLIALAIRLTTRDSVIYWSQRVGKNSNLFAMPKFRSMASNAPTVPTTLMKDSAAHITFLGKFIRHSSLDELPQIYSILKGDMSFVGPRPIIHKETVLIALRHEKKVDAIVPGLTGLAQINGRDNLTMTEKVAFDLDYMQSQSRWLDIKILLITAFKVIKLENISH